MRSWIDFATYPRSSTSQIPQMGSWGRLAINDKEDETTEEMYTSLLASFDAYDWSALSESKLFYPISL